MENRIDLVELLKYCPQGMELECSLIEGLEFDSIVDNEYLPIRCRIKNPKGGYNVYNFTKYGCWFNTTFAKCVIFPKNKTSWEGFVPPCQFKDGDILTTDSGNIFILKEPNENNFYYSCYIALIDFDSSIVQNRIQFCGKSFCRLATNDEKVRLFMAIKDNGYNWNAETKKLEVLLKFKVGDKIQSKKCKEERTIKICGKSGYWTTIDSWININEQDNWELVSNKFDINTLIPFESKVLVRSGDSLGEWKPAIFGIYRSKYNNFYAVGGTCWKHCIPYEGNEHLLGTTNDCDEYFKTWNS
jgi:hypothetical protein